jgi:hypothetical protein
MNVEDLINLLEKHPNSKVAFFDDNADEYGDLVVTWKYLLMVLIRPLWRRMKHTFMFVPV